MKSLERASGTCDSAGTPCVSLQFSYPAITPVPTSPAADSVAGYIRDQMFTSVEDVERSLSFDSIAAEMIEQHHDLVEEFADYRSPWELKRTASVLRDTGGIVSVRFHETSFLGGAHPLDIVRLASFDAETGKRLMYGDMFRPGYEQSFALISERGFRRARDIPDSVALADAGFWVEEGKFEPSQNFAVGKSDLILYFNPYEIGPYVMGPTEVHIPFPPLKDIVRRNGPLDHAE